MEKTYISLGSNCTVASQLNRAEKRTVSYPLDWLFTYHSVYKLFENDFKDYLNTEIKPINTNLWPDAPSSTQIECNKDYSTIFMHQDYEAGQVYREVIQRRVDRLLDTLREQKKEVVFIRRGHPEDFHRLIPLVGFTEFENTLSEREDMERLVEILKRKYPSLKFKIHLFYNCKCKAFEDCDTDHLRTKHIPGRWAETDDILYSDLTVL